jgi:hypothetical protein
MTRARDLADSADKDIAGTLTLDAVNASGVITGLTVEATGDTAAGDNAAMGYTAAEGLILTGQGSTGDVTIKNDADAVVLQVPTGTTNVNVIGSLDVATNAVIDGTALVTGVLTTTAATVFNGGFVSNANSTVNPTGGVITLGANGHIISKQSLDVATAGGRFIGQSNRGELGNIGIEQTANSTDGGYIRFSTAPSGSTTSAEAMRIQSNGSVGIGVTNPSSFNSGAYNLVVGDPSINSQGMTIAADTSSILYFADGTSGAETFAGSIIYNHSDNNMTFRTNGFNSALVIASDQSVSTPTAGTSNVKLGVNAGNSIASGGNYNVCIGDEAGTAISTGDKNIAVGFTALNGEVLGSQATAVGYQALFSQNMGSSVNSDNTAVGYNAGSSISTGKRNTILGASAGLQGQTIDDSVIIGYNAGGGAVMTGHDNVLIGKDSGQSMTSGQANVMVGRDTGQATNTGQWNIAIGDQALQANQDGDGAVAIGRDALAVFEPADGLSYNVVIGYQAGAVVTTGLNNTLVGGVAGDALQGGHNNTAVGMGAAGALISGGLNTAIGESAAKTLTTGGSNVCIGEDADVSASGNSNSICLGVGIAAAANDFSFGKSGNVVTNDFDTDANWSRSSDERLKKNITNQTLGLDFINDLRTVKYKWKANGELDASDSQLAHLRKTDDDGNIINYMNTDATMHNFIAQEVKAALDTAGVSDFAGWKEDHYGVQQVSREMFVIPLVKAVQELSTKLDAALARIATLEG